MSNTPLFPTGQIVLTPGAIQALKKAQKAPAEYLNRHAQGDWSEMAAEDQRENRYSLDKYLRIFSVYQLSSDVRIWIITEADRSLTTVLLPSEY